jgi:hypothetical protein
MADKILHRRWRVHHATLLNSGVMRLAFNSKDRCVNLEIWHGL